MVFCICKGGCFSPSLFSQSQSLGKSVFVERALQALWVFARICKVVDPLCFPGVPFRDLYSFSEGGQDPASAKLIKISELFVYLYQEACKVAAESECDDSWRTAGVVSNLDFSSYF